MKPETPRAIHLKDYRPPAYLIDTVALDFDLDKTRTRVRSRLSLRAALRYYTQSAADFYSPVIPRPAPAVLSSDQRLAAFGGLSPSVRALLRLESGFALEALLGYTENRRGLRPSRGSEAFETLRAWWGLVGMSRDF